MALDALFYLTHLAMLLLIGLLAAMISQRLKISKILLLLLSGIIISNFEVDGQKLFLFPMPFLTSLAVLTLVILVFDGSSRLSIRQFDKLSLSAAKLTVIFLLLNVAILTFFTWFLFDMDSLLFAAVFAIIVSGTAPDIIVEVLKEKAHSVIDLLTIESIINTPIVVLLPFMVLGFAKEVGTNAFGTLISQFVPFLNQVIAGVGAGVLIGVIIFKIIRKISSAQYFPLVILTSALLTYVLAENMGGSGVLGVAVQGLLFGNAYARESASIQDFSRLFSTLLEILVFILVGVVISMDFTFTLIWKSLVLFLVYVVIRFISVQLSFGTQYDFGEKLFVTLCMPKGIAVAVIAFALSTEVQIGGGPILDLILLFMLYSIVLAIIVSRQASSFMPVKQEKVSKAAVKN